MPDNKAVPTERLAEVLDDLDACDAGEFSIYTLAFTVARLVVEYNDPGFLDRLPARLVGHVDEICSVYRRDGYFFHHSSLGSTDHAETAKRLCELLDEYRI